MNEERLTPEQGRFVIHPYLHHRMGRLVGKRVEVHTSTGSFMGEIVEPHPDHLLLKLSDHRQVIIPIASIASMTLDTPDGVY